MLLQREIRCSAPVSISDKSPEHVSWPEEGSKRGSMLFGATQDPTQVGWQTLAEVRT